MNNLELYNKYSQPPQDALKAFDNGRFKGTDINPMWRIKALTEAFGPCGVGWYTDVVRMWREDTDDDASTVYCHLNLYIKYDGEWSKPISGIGGNTLTKKNAKGVLMTTDEAYKMAYTDAMGIACKALGFGGDIWWKEARTKYTANNVDAEREAKQAEANARNAARNAAASPAKMTTSTKVGIDRKALLNAVMERLGCNVEQFGMMRQTLIDGGVIPNKSTKEMTDDEYQHMLEAAIANFAA
jgi:hypothetical protein